MLFSEQALEAARTGAAGTGDAAKLLGQLQIEISAQDIRGL